MILNKNIIKKIDNEFKKYPINQKKSAIIAALTIAQNYYGWLFKELQKEIAKHIGIPYILVKEIATFYKMYNLKPQGKYKIVICTSLPCILSGSKKIASYFKNKLQIKFNEITKDKKFILINGECMGICGNAPVILINNKRICNFMSKIKINKLLKELN